ncbi:MAG: secondary thiamine-phosphate synthase enzyme YjbQ [Elusimicrobiota bacterium]|nr:secondary thiamine-phosphate synthase enzyme YjbQ [Elusimicrobiota bacterium]
MFYNLKISTNKQTEFIDITSQVQKKISQSEISDGVCVVFVPHTTAGITINENADPNVVKDILMMFDKKIPMSDSDYRHSEGNSAAHIKASILGSSVSVIIENGKLQLGTWQGIYFCEFDGPRIREIWIKTIG